MDDHALSTQPASWTVSANHDGSGESLGAFWRWLEPAYRNGERPFLFAFRSPDCCLLEGLSLPVHNIPVGAQEQAPYS